MSDARWPVWKLSILLYPFAAGAVAINLFLLSLLGQVFGLAVLSPNVSVIGGVILGVPAGWASGKWARHLMDQADS